MVKNIKNGIYRLEYEWADSKDWGKIKFILKNCEDLIIDWHKEQYTSERAESYNYDEWKKTF
jgi:hypothetical protein